MGFSVFQLLLSGSNMVFFNTFQFLRRDFAVGAHRISIAPRGGHVGVRVVGEVEGDTQSG
jgi:hypothetical protein